jgi:chemotaxis protein methyltransferase CheR
VTPPLADRATLERLRAAVAGLLGLQFDDARLELLAGVAADRLPALGLASLEQYARRLETGADREEIRALAERLTVGETYFFRNGNDLEAFVGVVLPDRLRARAATRRLRVLSAGCSSGEEPYTLAMLLVGRPELAGWDVAVRGVDVNPAAIRRAAAARYGPWSLRQTPADARERFFRAHGRELVVNDDVRALVSFEERNLVEPDPRLWARGVWDVVFCRNVLMYLAPERTREVVARIAASLAPGGFLFLGHAETLRGQSAEFHLRHSHETFYYQLREGGDAELAVGAAAPPGPPPELSAPAGDGDWVEAIARASDRIAALGVGPAPAPAAIAPRPEPAGGGLVRALDLLRLERFSEALRALGPAEAAHEDVDALLLRAVLLASSGDPAGAERICARVLAADELNAEAHYVKALCREHAGDRAAASDHDHYALYLDPSFAMPRLHLGLMARRAGDEEGARRELSRALALLAGEDGSRILLLGGGFGRDALLALCRAELRAAGAQP